jgi:hypothetical protein
VRKYSLGENQRLGALRSAGTRKARVDSVPHQTTPFLRGPPSKLSQLASLPGRGVGVATRGKAVSSMDGAGPDSGHGLSDGPALATAEITLSGTSLRFKPTGAADDVSKLVSVDLVLSMAAHFGDATVVTIVTASLLVIRSAMCCDPLWADTNETQQSRTIRGRPNRLTNMCNPFVRK